MSYMIDRRSIANFDWLLFIVTLLLAGIGVLNMFSAGGRYYGLHQAVYVLMGIGGIAVMLLLDYRRYERLAPFIYLSAFGLLLLVHAVGQKVSGSRSWISLQYFHLQPSELMKIAVILSLARLFNRDKTSRPYSLWELWLPGFIAGLPIVFILLEPDMGTAVTLTAIGGSMILLMGVEKKAITVILIITLVAAPGMWLFGLKPHQKARITTFLQPNADPLGSGYNALQSKIAIGSGGPWGKGYKKGTQNMLRFLPEQHTDFAFAVWAEEWGFAGATLLIVLFCILMYRGVQTALLAKDHFGGLLCMGAVLLIFWHTVINLAMIGGIFPVIGIPLPFISYGGSHMITVMAAVGFLFNVRMRRYTFRE